VSHQGDEPEVNPNGFAEGSTTLGRHDAAAQVPNDFLNGLLGLSAARIPDSALSSRVLRILLSVRECECEPVWERHSTLLVREMHQHGLERRERITTVTTQRTGRTSEKGALNSAHARTREHALLQHPTPVWKVL
jgi:hypothetical protein